MLLLFYFHLNFMYSRLKLDVKKWRDVNLLINKYINKFSTSILPISSFTHLPGLFYLVNLQANLWAASCIFFKALKKLWGWGWWEKKPAQCISGMGLLGWDLEWLIVMFPLQVQIPNVVSPLFQCVPRPSCTAFQACKTAPEGRTREGEKVHCMGRNT